MSVSSQSQRQLGESPSELPDPDVADESNATTVIPPATDDRSHDSVEPCEATGVGESETVETDIADDGNLQRDVTRDPVAASVPVNMEPSAELRSNEEEPPPQETPSPPVPDGPLERTGSVRQVRLPDGSRALFAPRRSVLLSFAGMFALMIGYLELLNYLSRRYTGIATVEQGAHYLWTYGPTFVLTVIAIFWARVEFQIKQATPWMELQRGETVTKNSLMLNYTTAPIYEILVKSIRRSHYSVALVVSGTVILQLATIASTGLLRLEYRDIDRRADFVVFDRFDFLKNNKTADKTVGPKLWAIQYLNASYPAGTSPNEATQSFASIEEVHNATLTTDLEVFTANLKCEPFQWHYSVDPDKLLPANTTIWNMDQFQICVPVDLRSISYSIPKYCFFADVELGEESTGAVHTVRCLENTEEALCILIYQATIQTDASPNTTIYVHAAPHFRALVGTICVPEYSLTRRTIVNSTEASSDNFSIKVSQSIKESLPLGATSANITTSIVDSMNGGYISANSDFEVGTDWSPWFKLLSTARPGTDSNSLNDSQVIANVSRQMFPNFAHQWAHSGKTMTANYTTMGVITQNIERLCTQELSLRILEASLAMMVLASAALSFGCCLPQNLRPVSLFSHALVLAQSPRLETLLRDTGPVPDRTAKTISTHCFPVSPRTAELSVTSRSADASNIPRSKSATNPGTWRPIAMSRRFRSGVIMVPIAVVVALEALYQYSSSRRGIADISLKGYEKYVWAFTPTLTLSLLAFSFTMLDISTRVLHPYQPLRKGHAEWSVLTFDLLGIPTIIAVFQSSKEQKYVLSIILIASVTGPILPIVASGLFATEVVRLEQTVPIQLNGWFDFEDFNRAQLENDAVFNDKDLIWKFGSQYNAPSSSDLITFDNVSYPQWTYDQLAFPTLQLGEDTNTDLLNTTSELSIIARLPAVRVQSSCSSEEFTGTMDTLNTDPRYELHSTLSCPDSMNACIVFGDGVLQPDMDGLAAMEGTAEEDDSQSENQWFVIGEKVGGAIKEPTLLRCMPYVEALYADVRLSYPLYQFDNPYQPTPVEDSARFFFRNRNIYSTAKNYIGLPAIDFLLPKDSIPPGANSSLIDYFFQALIWGRDGVPLEELADKRKVNTTLIPAIERLMARQWAQYINSLFRSTNTSGFTNTTDDQGNPVNLHEFLSNLTATVIDDKNRLRLVQSAISTHLLGGLLLFMVSCALISFICSRRQTGGGSSSKILFQDPGSIAAKMGLFVGSKFVERLRNEVVWDGSQAGDGAAGAEERSWQEMEARAKNIFEGTTFSLGWWADGEGGEAGRRFGIDIGEADDRWDGDGA